MEKLPEQPASRTADAKAANHDARNGGEACSTRNIGPVSSTTTHHVAASSRLQSGILSVND
jgi:hypothetical protein